MVSGGRYPDDAGVGRLSGRAEQWCQGQLTSSDRHLKIVPDTFSFVDSAIKIGLGALIAGSVSLFTLRMTHRNEREKEFRAHRIKTIETTMVTTMVSGTIN